MKFQFIYPEQKNSGCFQPLETLQSDSGLHVQFIHIGGINANVEAG